MIKENINTMMENISLYKASEVKDPEKISNKQKNNGPYQERKYGNNFDLYLEEIEVPVNLIEIPQLDNLHRWKAEMLSNSQIGSVRNSNASKSSGFVVKSNPISSYRDVNNLSINSTMIITDKVDLSLPAFESLGKTA